MPEPTTFIIRHKRENLKKCSLSGLEKRKDFHFLSYPLKEPFDASNMILLSLNGDPLTISDKLLPLLILDGTWKYAAKIERQIIGNPIRKSLPKTFLTAYPRKQEDCSEPTRGLASIEAIFLAYFILKRDTTGLLDHYYWKEKFIDINRSFLLG